MALDPKKTKALRRFHSAYESDQVNDYMAEIIDSLGMNPTSVRDLADKPISKIEAISTGVVELDDILGIGGLPRKSYIHLYGMPKSGKSWLAQKTMVQVSKTGGRTLYMDVENGFNPFRAKQLGADLNRTTFANEFDSGEMAIEFLCKSMYNPEYEERTGLPCPKRYDLIVFDSMAASGSKNQLEANIGGVLSDKKSPSLMPGTKALMFSNFLPKMNRAIAKSEGIWEEEMKLVLLASGEPLFLSPEDLGKEKMKLITDVVEARKDIPHDFLLEAIARGNNLAKVLTDLVNGEFITAEQAASHAAAMFKGKIEQHEKLINKLPEEGAKILSRFDQMAGEMERGFPILNSPDPELDEFETKVLNGRIMDSTRKGLYVVHYNPGPAVIMINQLRTTGIGTGMTKKEPPGGATMQYLCGTAIQTKHVSKSGGGEIKDGEELVGWKSQFTIDQSRFTKPHVSVEVTIPYTDLAPDPLTELISLVQAKDLYSFSRSTHKIPKDGSLIKTKDDEEFYLFLIETGLDYLAGELKWETERMDTVRNFLFEKLAEVAEGMSVEADDEGFEDEAEDE